MNHDAYYEKMRSLAREVRQQYGLTTPRVLKSDMRRIYKDQGIRIDLWPHKFKQIRGAYFDDECGPTVMLRADLPQDPMIFTMGHELKHHIEDREKTLSYCTTGNVQEPIEIGAEVFAAELLFPEQDFINCLDKLKVEPGQCTAEALVRLKHETRTTLSYAGLAKTAKHLHYTESTFEKVAWKKLEEQLYGVPVYKLLPRSRNQHETTF